MTAPSTPSNRGLSYRPELDGVRAIAVLAVLGFHLSFIVPSLKPYLAGGFLGVDVFFVLSGMLITELIVSDHFADNAATVKAFYRRRARRLLPALVTFVVASVVYYQLVHGAGVRTIKTYASVISYVDTGHLTSPWSVDDVTQVWTLLIEWEFYIFWPAMLVFALRRNTSLRTIGRVAAAAALSITAIRAAVYLSDGHNFNVSYYSAWLRFDELLVGCALGLLGSRPQAPNWLRWVALGGVLGVIARARYSDGWLYVGGMILIALATAAVVQPRERSWSADRILASRPMVWIGKLSYSLYLWSATAIGEVAAHSHGWSAAPRLVVATAASFALAVPSYYLVERRFRLPSRHAAVKAAPG